MKYNDGWSSSSSDDSDSDASSFEYIDAFEPIYSRNTYEESERLFRYDFDYTPFTLGPNVRQSEKAIYDEFGEEGVDDYREYGLLEEEENPPPVSSHDEIGVYKEPKNIKFNRHNPVLEKHWSDFIKKDERKNWAIFPNAPHLGPGNPIAPLPYDELDAIAWKHDQLYAIAKTPMDIVKADEEFVEEMNAYKPNSWLKENLANLGKYGIAAKMGFERIFGIQYPNFSEEELIELRKNPEFTKYEQGLIQKQTELGFTMQLLNKIPNENWRNFMSHAKENWLVKKGINILSNLYKPNKANVYGSTGFPPELTMHAHEENIKAEQEQSDYEFYHGEEMEGWVIRYFDRQEQTLKENMELYVKDPNFREKIANMDANMTAEFDERMGYNNLNMLVRLPNIMIDGKPVQSERFMYHHFNRYKAAFIEWAKQYYNWYMDVKNSFEQPEYRKLLSEVGQKHVDGYLESLSNSDEPITTRRSADGKYLLSII